MSEKFSLDFIEVDNDEMNELVELFKAIPNEDPYKDEHYKNLKNVHGFIKENEDEQNRNI